MAFDKKKINNFLIFLTFISFVLFSIFFIIKYNDKIHEVLARLSFQKFVWITLTLFFCQLWMSLTWTFFIKKLSCKLSWIKLVAVWQVSTLGIYLPGSIWNFVGRVYLLNQLSVSKRLSTYTVIMEFVVLLSAGFFLACLTPNIFEYLHLNKMLGWLLLPFPFIIFFHNYMGKLLHKFRIFKFELKTLPKPHFLTLLSFFLGMVILHFLFGFALLTLLNSLHIPLNGLNIFNLTGYFAISLALGYIIVIAPNGIGVREGILVLLLQQHIPTTESVIVSFSFRFFNYAATPIGILWGLIYLKLNHSDVNFFKKDSSKIH